ncbi:MAG: hypothetical protein ACJ78Q_02370 [Chloroflexia bacterium]
MAANPPNEPETTAPAAKKPRRRSLRILGTGCLLLCLFLCSGVGLLALALQSGPVQIGLPNNNFLKLGSDNLVLSNSSFQNGTTYYLDLNGNGVRNILELHNLTDLHTFEIVLNHATKDDQREHHLLTMPSP